MGTYTLELELFGGYTMDMPGFEIWEDGVLHSSHFIALGGTSISTTINYSGALPSSLQFRFDDASSETGRTIEIRSVMINDKVVNMGNLLSIATLNKGQNAVVDVANGTYLFNSQEPASSVFTSGATLTLTTNNDTVRVFNDSNDPALMPLAGAMSFIWAMAMTRLAAAQAMI